MSGFKTDFSVSIYPGGHGFKQGDEPPARIYFSSNEEKEAYVAEEQKFCAVAAAEFNGALSNAERTSKRIELLKRRSFFASKKGYAPTMADKSVWTYRPPIENKTV